MYLAGFEPASSRSVAVRTIHLGHRYVVRVNNVYPEVPGRIWTCNHGVAVHCLTVWLREHVMNDASGIWTHDPGLKALCLDRLTMAPDREDRIWTCSACGHKKASGVRPDAALQLCRFPVSERRGIWTPKAQRQRIYSPPQIAVSAVLPNKKTGLTRLHQSGKCAFHHERCLSQGIFHRIWFVYTDAAEKTQPISISRLR